jgi:NAD(P)-dependent dehydrogenase (short-subunit alcohol dehydrogenase family)
MSVFRLDGKTAFITGAGSGIGEAIARGFAAQGARVVIGDIDEAAGRRVADEIGGNAVFRRTDVSDSANVREALEWTATEHGGLHVLVNNAGIPLVGNAEETTEEDFERLLRVNVSGVFHGCKHVIPIMTKQGGGNIVNIGSVAGLVCIERRFAYSATKGAVIAMTRQLAIDYVAQGIRVNCICPGTVYTPFVDAYLRKYHAHEIEETKAKLDARQPMGRMGRPEEIANMALYLAADESEFITGSILTIDGGLTAR